MKFDYGLLKTWKYETSEDEQQFGYGNLLIFPNLLCIESEVQWRVPIDENHTLMFLATIMDESQAREAESKIEFRTVDGAYDLRTPFGQDAMALEQSYRSRINGAPFRLGRSDVGIKMFRDMLQENIDLANNGDPAKNECVSRYRASDFMGGYLPSTATRRRVSNVADIRAWKEIANDSHISFSF